MALARRVLPKVVAFREFIDPDTAFETHVLEIQYYLKADEAETAFDKLDALSEGLREDDGAVCTLQSSSHRILPLIGPVSLLPPAPLQ